MNIKVGDRFKVLRNFDKTTRPIKVLDIIEVSRRKSDGELKYINHNGDILCTVRSRNGKILIKEGYIKKVGYNRRKLSSKRLP